MTMKYNITLETSKGMENGVLEVNNSGNIITGEMTSKIANTKFTDGVIEGNILTFSGKIKIKFMNVNYSAKCKLEGDSLKGVVKTKFGDFKVTGKKVN